MIKTKRQMFVVIGAFLLVLLLGTTTYAFFNYTKTGTANTIKTGRIAFDAEQNGLVTLSDLFPIDASGTITSSTPGVGSLSIHVTGDTNYEEGIEYLVKAVNVTSSSNGKALPISIQISYEANTGKSIGEADDNYYTNRGGDTSIYKLLSTDKIENNGDIVVGYIAPGQTGIDGNITILAYLDASNIAITDTYDEDNPETALNGTTTNWVDGRAVFTTEEWNDLQENGVSFQIKIESNEGIWVDEPALPDGTIDSCPGCMFVWIDESTGFEYGVNGDDFDDIFNGLNSSDYVYSANYEDVITSERRYFMGMILENGDSGKIMRVFACGVKNENPNSGTPFCIEGTPDGTKHNSNIELITGPALWDDSQFESRCYATGTFFGNAPQPSCVESYDYDDITTYKNINAGSGTNGSAYVISPSTNAGVGIDGDGNNSAWFNPYGN